MSEYKVIFYTGNYSERQAAANKDNCQLYIEQHLNSILHDDMSTTTDNYIMACVASNASARTQVIGMTYAKNVQLRLEQALVGNFPLARSQDFPGTTRLVRGARGEANIFHAKMPALLLEPMWVSDLTSSKSLLEGTAVKALAKALIDTIEEHFPDGATIGFSIGHKGKASAPHDRGAPICDGVDNPQKLCEADLAEQILTRAATILAIEKPSHMPESSKPFGGVELLKSQPSPPPIDHSKATAELAEALKTIAAN